MSKILKAGALLLCSLSLLGITGCDAFKSNIETIESSSVEQENTDIYIINLVVNVGDTNSVAKISVSKGDTVNLNDWIPEVEGYEFIGWYLDSDFVLKPTKTEITINSDISLYAKFESVSSDLDDMM